MARVEVIKNFLSAGECFALSAWAKEAVAKKWLDLGISRDDNQYSLRLTTRMYGERFDNPDLALLIFGRIRNTLSLPDAPIIEAHGKDGIVVSYTYPGGDVYMHKDPPPQTLRALRCNIITQMPDAGGELWVDDTHIPVDVGDLHCYLVSDYSHCVTKVLGQTPRILWMFGLCVSATDWEYGKIQAGEFA